MKVFRWCGFLSLWVASWGHFACAQSTAQIQGTVRDASGAAVPGADVKATQTATGVARATTTGTDGGYVLANLPLGPYQLEVTKEGFSKYAQTGIELGVDDSPTIDVPMKVGALTEQVQVEANAALVETQTTGISGVMENQRILELPLNGRNPTDLIALTGAAVAPGPAFNASSRSFQGVLGGQGYSVAGGQTSGITYVLDGAFHNNAYDNLNLPLPFPDALQEFKVETSALPASNGIHGGATITSVTKSGTNEIHGDVFEFIRNNALNATNPFAARGTDGKRLTDGLKRNQFGGTVGGPIVKNKVFYFGAFQGTMTRQRPADSLAFVPTASMLAGDFTAFASPACNNGRQITLAAPFGTNGQPANKVSPTLFSPAALKIAATLPTPADACGTVRYIQPISQDEYQGVGKIDYQISPKNSFFGRYIATTLTQVPPYQIVKNILATGVGGRDNLAQTITLGDTHLFSPTTIDSFRVAFNRTAIHRLHAPFYSAPQVGVNAYSYQPDVTLLTVTGGGFAIGNGTESESRFKTTTYSIGNDLNLVRGKHQFAFGGTGAMWNSASYANVRSPGVYSFDGSQTGLGLGDFLTGKLALDDAAAPNTIFMRQWYAGFYGQDTWKVAPRLTLNLGLRWEPWFPQIITNGAIYNFSYQRYIQGIKSTVYQNAPPGLYYPGDPGFPGKSGQYHHLADFEPRVGLAWDPLGDGKMSIRASYGLFYEFANGQFFINSTIAPPFGDEVRVQNPAGGFDNPWLGFPGGNPFPVSFDPKNAYFPLFGPYLTLNYDMPPTEMHSWNFSVQRQFGNSWLAQANYIGNETEHLWTSYQLNPGALIPGAPIVATCPATSTTQNCPQNTNARRVLTLLNPTNGQYFSQVDVFDPGGTQSYNGVLLSLTHRLSHGLTANANYNWSHCIGDYSQEFTTPNVASGYQFPNNRRADRGDCVFDIRQNFALSASYELPRFSNNIARVLASDWRISPIFQYRTGQALTIVTGVDRNLLGNTATQRPNQVVGNVYAGGFLNYLNPVAFQQPALATFGNMGTYDIRGPGQFQVSAGVSRVFPIRERIRLEIRGEAFNLPNFFLRGNPGASLSNAATFGQITSAANPRILQFAGKIMF